MSGEPVPRVYLDANILIYVIEGTAPFREQLADLMAALDAGRLRGVTSDLTFAEVMVKPFASHDEKFIAAYRQLLSAESAIEVVSINRAALEKSAMLRAQIGGKLADGIHVATALLANCGYFISEDDRIKVPPGLALVKSNGVPALLASIQGAS